MSSVSQSPSSPSSRLSKLRKLVTFLGEERVRAHARMRTAQAFLNDPQMEAELGHAARDTIECIRRNAEEVSYSMAFGLAACMT